MSEEEALTEFSGTARLFPLPNLVLFPNVVQPLHIFEPRYRQMTADALKGDRLLAIVLLQPGWEDLYNGRPPIHSVACLGRVIADQLMPDGRYNLLLRGMQRIKIRREVDSEKLYRMARAELIEDIVPSDLDAKKLRKRLESFVVPRFRAKGAAVEQMADLFHGELPLGSLCDVLSFALPFPPQSKQELLEQNDVEQRVEQMIGLIEQHTAAVIADRSFPPDFSKN
ncbi:MAG: LON peptidase substrate-binding domain-containing protein [Gemmataceae bacterium]